MNKEYVNLNDNIYAVTNENGNIKMIKCSCDPENMLKLQNMLEEKQKELESLSYFIAKKDIHSFIRTYLNIIITFFTICGVFLTFSNLTAVLCVLGLNVCANITLNELIGSIGKLKKQINEATGKSLIILEEKEILEKEYESLSKMVEYKEVYNYERYLDKNKDVSMEKPMVRKLTLK